MSERQFKNSWSRLERATEHLTAFQAGWNRLTEDGFSTVAAYDKDGGWYVARVIPNNPAVREALRQTTLPLILGEYAYQLRAALDNLVWDAITFTQGTEPPPNASQVYFPVVTGKAKFKDCGFRKFPFPQKLDTWIESIQPDLAEKPLGHPDRGLAGAILDINNLAKFDRHRRLRVIASFPTELYVDFVFDPPEGFKAVAIEGQPCNLLGDEDELLRFKVESETGERPRNISLATGVKFEIFFEDLVTYKDVAPGERLCNLCAAVEYIIVRFENEFA